MGGLGETALTTLKLGEGGMAVKTLNYREHITSDPLICHGQPCIKGTRIMVSTILGALGAGTSYEEIIQEYPPIADADIRACLLFAAELADYIVVDLPRR